MIPVPEVTNVDMAFGGSKAMDILPKMDEIPKEFRDFHNKWSKIINKWFFSGGKIKEAIPKEGVDKYKAVRAIGCVLASYEPKHEHKTAGAAYLLSEWFDVFEIEEKETT